ncbi:MAG: hypothetical protein IPM51_07300 [Sphingobacteriaceae bacterium]|nr:hypothetical protein [Sphingobacteriaceae bacterium]
MFKHTCYSILFGIILSACIKDKPQVVSSQAVNLSNASKILIVNEGNFMSSNASVSLYDPGSGSVIEDYYKNQNGTSLGDVAQSMYYFNGNYYTVVNNSGKIMVCNRDFKLTSTINGFTSPRYILPVSNGKAYVSELYGNQIKIVNLNTNQITGGIICPGWTEKMVKAYHKVFITNPQKNYCYVINSISDEKTDSVFVGINAASIVVDANDKIWVLSSGDLANSIAPLISRINPISLEIELAYAMAMSDRPTELCLNKNKDTLYYLNKGICKMSIQSNSTPSSPFISGGNRNYYGLNIDPHSNVIYVSDVLDYIQKSNVYLFDVNGNEKKFFKAGIIANSFYFE